MLWVKELVIYRGLVLRVLNGENLKGFDVCSSDNRLYFLCVTRQYFVVARSTRKTLVMNCFLMMMKGEVLRCFEEEQIESVDNDCRGGDGDRNYSWLKGIQRRRGTTEFNQHWRLISPQ